MVYVSENYIKIMDSLCSGIKILYHVVDICTLPKTDELVCEKEKYKAICDDLDGTFSELSAY